ncbi:MAG: response regulator transcription factor [Bryobacterales bacterium]|nr:response regulator transcription factor [Bryobacterales bacterium]
MARILVVEDEPAIALGLEEDLRLEGYDVDVATDGETGLEKARHGTFDLVLLDVMLPRRDGFSVCRELRRTGVTTPVILLTARAQEAEKVLGLKLGADDYVTKPFSPMELCARVQAVLRRAAGTAPEVCRFGGMEVNFTRGELLRAGRAVDLTPIEFKLLAVFVRSRGRVLSRGQLIEQVWSKETYITERVVDTHVSNLRKKVEPEGEPRFIVSVRGIGYRFDG